MKRCFPIALAVLSLISGCVCAGRKEMEHGDGLFQFHGKPIHPMSIAPLVGDLADERPVVTAIDLEGSARNRSNAAKVTIDGRTVKAVDGDSFVAYRYVGMTPGGIHVLIVMVNGGGSGVFEDVLWVKLVPDQVWEYKKERNRTSLTRIGQFTLGDRDDGEVKLNGSKLLIGKSRYRQRDTLIPLE